MSYRVCLFCFLCGAFASSITLRSQTVQSESSQRGSAAVQRIDSIPTKSVEYLERHADELRSEKQYFEAVDNYRAASVQAPNSAVIYNKLGICELLIRRFGNAKLDFERAIKLDAHYASAYNNLGVLDYSLRKYGRAIKRYEKAISLEPDSASYYSNLGSAYFAKKDWQKSIDAYNRAVTLDPDVFEHNNSGGTVGQIASPEDRAHFSYMLARLYAKSGLTDRSLECLRRAIEDGYKGVDAVYKDAEFAQLRKDPRFLQLMAARPPSIPE